MAVTLNYFMVISGLDGSGFGFSPDDFSMLLEYDDGVAVMTARTRDAPVLPISVWRDFFSTQKAASITEDQLQRLFSAQTLVS